MQPRKTVRILLLDSQDRLLLIRMHDPNVGDASGKVLARPYWVTVGGEIDTGEDIASAARREITEETGLVDVALGPPVWTTEHTLCIGGKNRLMQETFILARTARTALGRDGWTELERQVIHDMRWWSLGELQATREMIFPTSLVQHLPPLLAGHLPANPVAIVP